MQTLKTALVVVALLAVLFVAYQALNKQQIELPFDLGAVGAGAAPEPDVADLEGVNVEAPPLGSWDSPGVAAPPPVSPASYPNAAASVELDAASSSFSATSPAFEPLPSESAGVGSAAPSTTPDRSVSPAVALSPSTDAVAAAPTPEIGAADDSNSVRGGASLAAPLRDPGKPAAQPPADSEDAGPARYSSPATARYAFEQASHQAEGQIAEGQLARALLTLSAFYRHPDLDAETQKKLNERLDQLAGTVIYSTRHLLEQPHKAMRGETLQAIATRYKAPLRLLQNINGIRDPELLVPGTELKVLRGPFRADIDMARGELTMFLGSLYAGRFPVETGADPAPRPGEYSVRDIQPGRAYYAPSGQMVPAGNPENPYGSWWIDLGGEMCIHGSPASGATGGGCLSLSPGDASDVAAILSVGSKVVIR